MFAYFRTICGCGTEANAAMLLFTSQMYSRAVTELVDSGKYDTHDDFTVVVQPFFENTLPPRTVCNKIKC